MVDGALHNCGEIYMSVFKSMSYVCHIYVYMCVGKRVVEKSKGYT